MKRDRTVALVWLSKLVSLQWELRDIPPALHAEVIDLAVRHGLAPMLLYTARQAGEDTTADAVWQPLEQAARHAAARCVLLSTACKAIAQALGSAGIPALWVKGFALAHTIYPQPALRPMTDLDVLVPYEQREAALQAVRALGYHFYKDDGLLVDTGDDIFLSTSHHFYLVGGPADTVALELHSRLLSATDDLLPLDRLGWFWAQSQRIETAAGSVLTLGPEAHLLYLCAHTVLQHGEADLYLLRHFDLHLLVGYKPLDWQLVVDQAAALKWTYAVERAVGLAAQLFGTPLPHDLLHQLRARRPADEDLERVARLGQPGARWERAQMRLAALPAGDRVRLAVRSIAPPAAYMRQRYAIRAGRPVWPYYLYRWFYQGREILRALWQRAVRRSGNPRPRP
jgi:hypothetical protein